MPLDKQINIKTYGEIVERQPELSYVAPQNFYMIFDKLPQITFNAQTINIPTISVGESDIPNRFNAGTTAIPGDSMDYGQLDVQFLIEKSFRNYRSCLRWLKSLANPESHEQFVEWVDEHKYQSRGDFSKLMSDCSVFGTDSANNILAEWKFKNAFPVSVDSPDFDATATDVEFLVSTMSLRYTYFTFETYTDGVPDDNLV